MIISETLPSSLNGDLRRAENGAPNVSARIGAGALDPLTLPPRESGSGQERDFQSPPHPRSTAALRLAEGALNRILSAFGPRVDGKPITLAQLERTPMEAMNLAAALLGVQSLGDSAELKSLALEIRTKGTEDLRLRQNEDLRKQVDKSIEDQQKAQKAGIFSAIVDWIISAAEVIAGVFKIVTGALRVAVGDATGAMDVAGGVMDFAAGCAGIVKAICETIALANPADKDRYLAVADIAGKVQLGFEIAGMCVSIVAVGRGLVAARAAAKGAETVMNATGGKLLENAVKQAGSAATKEAGQEIISNVAKEIASQVAAQTAEEVSKKLVGESQRLIKALSQSAIEKVVVSAIEHAGAEALKTGVNTTAKELSKQVVAEVQRELFKAVTKACLMNGPELAKATVRAGAQGSNGIFQGVNAKERAELQKTIQQLIADSNFVQFMLDEFEKLKKHVNEDIRNLVDGAGKALSGGSDGQLKTGAVLSSIAAHIV